MDSFINVVILLKTLIETFKHSCIVLSHKLCHPFTADVPNMPPAIPRYSLHTQTDESITVLTGNSRGVQPVDSSVVADPVRSVPQMVAPVVYPLGRHFVAQIPL